MRGLTAGLGVVLVAVLAGCAGNDGPGQSGQSIADTPTTVATSEKPQRKAFEPPKVFSASASASIPAANLRDRDATLATLHEGTLYSAATKSVQALDAINGKPLWTVKPTLGPAGSGVVHAPFVDESRVYAAFSVIVPGKGTTPQHPAIEVVAIDAKSGKADWTATVDVETSDPGNVDDGNVTVAGATPDSVVVTFTSQDFSLGKTYVLDAGSHQVRWKRDQYIAGEVDSGIVVGNAGKPFIGEPRALTALGLTDGAEKWKTDLGGYGAGIMPVSPKLVAVDRRDYGSGDQTFEILDVATGKARYTMPIDNKLGMTYRIACFYDQKSFIVCDGNGGERTFGFDVDNVGQQPLWKITKDTSRVPPVLTGAYHGLVYGTASNNKPVALDAKTGEDAPDAPGIAPIMVDKYVGITSKGETHVPTS